MGRGCDSLGRCSGDSDCACDPEQLVIDDVAVYWTSYAGQSVGKLAK